MVGGFELAGRLVMGIRAVVKAAVGERAAEPFVKEQEEQGDLNGIVTETGSEASGVSDRMSAWARSATAAIASRPRSSSTRSGSISGTMKVLTGWVLYDGRFYPSKLLRRRGLTSGGVLTQLLEACSQRV